MGSGHFFRARAEFELSEFGSSWATSRSGYFFWARAEPELFSKFDFWAEPSLEPLFSSKTETLDLQKSQNFLLNSNLKLKMSRTWQKLTILHHFTQFLDCLSLINSARAELEPYLLGSNPSRATFELTQMSSLSSRVKYEPNYLLGPARLGPSRLTARPIPTFWWLQQSPPSYLHILFKFTLSQMPSDTFAWRQQSPPSKLQYLMLFSGLQWPFPIAVGFGQQSLPSNSQSALKLIKSHEPSSIKERFLHGEGDSLKWTI